MLFHGFGLGDCASGALRAIIRLGPGPIGGHPAIGPHRPMPPRSAHCRVQPGQGRDSAVACVVRVGWGLRHVLRIQLDRVADDHVDVHYFPEIHRLEVLVGRGRWRRCAQAELLRLRSAPRRLPLVGAFVALLARLLARLLAGGCLRGAELRALLGAVACRVPLPNAAAAEGPKREPPELDDQVDNRGAPRPGRQPRPAPIRQVCPANSQRPASGGIAGGPPCQAAFCTWGNDRPPGSPR
mmetsp:Transcript_39007/g.117823  ORF Transcript_39007/g.117823 Transcript_39007/m.117823 type:complete len:240 (-) Transcript_39007:416-1135(-)